MRLHSLSKSLVAASTSVMFLVNIMMPSVAYAVEPGATNADPADSALAQPDAEVGQASTSLADGFGARESSPDSPGFGGRPSNPNPANPVSPANKPSFFDTTDRSFVNKYLQPGRYMPVSEVKEGMTGYGLSVFHGTKVEKFDVRILGVIKRMLNGRDAILARLSGPAMATNCVIRGMSGSPVYVNGKLIGSVSFGYDFSKEPIVGITPIVDSLDALAENQQQERIPLATVPGVPNAQLNVPPGMSGMPVVTSGGQMRMVPLVGPVSLAGFSPRAEQMLSEKFKSFGMITTSGTAGGINPELMHQAQSIQPGGAVAILLTTGDFTVAAVGTAIARFNNKVIAFGHPFMQAGSVDFPMATAYVHQVLPSMASSMKLASPVNVVGSFKADRPWACGGKIGSSSRMIPASFTVVDETRGIQRTYNCNVVDHPDLTPGLLSATALSSIDATHQAAGPYVALVESRIEAEGIEPIVRVDRFSSAKDAGILSLFGMGEPVSSYVRNTTGRIVDNEWQKSSIKSVKLKIVLQDGHEAAKIDRVWIEKPFVAPGEEVKVQAVLKPYNKKPVVETMSFTVPRDVPDGNLLIGVTGGDDLAYTKGRLGVSDPDPESLRQVAEQIREQGRGDQLNLVVALPEQSLLVNGNRITNPPPHWVKVFFSNRHTRGPSIIRGELHAVKNTRWLLSGTHIITVEVRNPDKAAARAVPYSVSTPSAGDEVAITDLARKTMESYPGKKGSNSSSSISPGSQSGGSSRGASQSIPLVGKEYPHMRPVQLWRQESEDEYRAGKLEGATVDSWGRLNPGFESKAEIAIAPEMKIWSGVWSGDFLYFATSDQVFRWKGDGSQPESVARFDSVMIPSMAASKGIVYVATVPTGRVFAIDTNRPGGKPRQVYKPTEPLVTVLATDDSGDLFIGVAGTGRIYKIDPQTAASKPAIFFDSGQAHILSMFYCAGDRSLYVGTGEKGSVYRVDPESGKAAAVYQSPDHLVTGVVRDKKGDLYVASAGQGHLVRVLPSGEAQTLASSEAFYTLHYDPTTDSVFSGDAEGDITMARIEPVTKQPYFMPVSHTEQEAVLLVSSHNKNLFAGTSNLAVLKSFAMEQAREPSFTSVVKDAGRPAQWSSVRPFGAFNEASTYIVQNVKVETRTGETSKPDETWSAWQSATAKDDAFTVQSPEGRYFQFRLSWPSRSDKSDGDSFAALTIGRIDVAYMPRGSTPQFASISLKAGTAVSGKQDLNMSGTDSDGDNLIASIEISSDDGKTWQSLTTNLRAKNTRSSSLKDKDKDGTKSADSGKRLKAKGKPILGTMSPLKGGSTSNSTAGKNKSGDKDEKDTDKGSKDSGKETGDSKSDSDKDKSGAEKSGSDKSGSDNSDGAKPDADKSGTEQSSTGRGALPLRLTHAKRPWFWRHLQDAPSGDEDKNKDRDKDNDKGKDLPKDRYKYKDKDKDKENDKAEGPPSEDGGTIILEGGGVVISTSSSKKDSSSSGSSGSSSSSDNSNANESFTYSWDTSKQKDGDYILKFVLDDRLSSPNDSQQVINLRSVIVDNSAPEIELITCKRTKDGTLELKVTGKDKRTAIANATFKIDDGDPYAFSFAPQTIDSLSATLVANNVKIDSGAHKVEVKVIDRAGNIATRTFSITR